MLLVCHFCVAASLCGLAIAIGSGPLGTIAVLVAGLAPLAAAYRGLSAGSRYTQQWLAIAMVFYLGIGLAETAASLGSTIAASALTFTSGAELVLLLRALRRVPTTPHESTES